MKHSKLGKIDIQDIIYSLIYTVLGSLLSGLVGVLSQGMFPSLMDLKAMAAIGLGAGVTHILVRIFHNSEGKLAKEPNNKLQ